MTKILYGVSPIGLGHASRASAVGLKLRSQGVDLEFASGGAAYPFLRSYGFAVHDIVTEPTPSEASGVMKRPGLWYLRYWSGYRSTKARMSTLMDKIHPDVVVGDEEFSSVSLAVERGLENVMISDELDLAFAQGALSRYIEKRVSVWYRRLQSQVSHLLVPDFGEDGGNVHYVGPVVRATTKTRDEVRSSLNLGPAAKFVLFSGSGSGIGDFLLDAVVKSFDRLGPSSTVLVVSGLESKTDSESVRYLGTVRENQNLVAAADLVISTAGKSTIDEAMSYGTPIIVVPIKNHSEQEENARALGYSYRDISRLGSLISERLGKRTPPRNYSGAENIASYVLGLIQEPQG